jgi:hypothetical protein
MNGIRDACISIAEDLISSLFSDFLSEPCNNNVKRTAMDILKREIILEKVQRGITSQYLF